MNGELKIEDLVLGSGKAAVKGALITTQYRGWLEDGTEFDSSYSRGKPFQCLKFRTMVRDADEHLRRWAVENPELHDEFLRTFKLKDDPRITAIGMPVQRSRVRNCTQPMSASE